MKSSVKELQVLVEINKYYSNGYYLGYMVLSNLVIQEYILKLLNRIEDVLKREEKESKRKDPTKILEKCTLGDLIGDLRKYIDSDLLFNGGRYCPLNTENKMKYCQFECCDSSIGGLNKLIELRNEIAHNLVTNEIDIMILEDKKKFSTLSASFQILALN